MLCLTYFVPHSLSARSSCTLETRNHPSSNHTAHIIPSPFPSPSPSSSPAKYWTDPDTFDPSRFLRDYPRDAFLPFSGGPRGCIGRGFAETESVAVLTLLIARYRVELRHEPRFAGESFEERRRRLLSSKLSVTL